MKRSKNISLLISTSGGKRPLTDLEKCLLLILRTKDNISTGEILKIAKKIRICASCSDQSEVFATGEKLIKKGLIKRTLCQNKYIWMLSVPKGRYFAERI